VEIDFAAVITSHATMSESQKNDIGNLVYNEYLGNFASGVADFCRHPLQKEAVLDLATARKITFVSGFPNLGIAFDLTK
jgi:lipopolysaccharide biosynthesis protein